MTTSSLGRGRKRFHRPEKRKIHYYSSCTEKEDSFITSKLEGGGEGGRKEGLIFLLLPGCSRRYTSKSIFTCQEEPIGRKGSEAGFSLTDKEGERRFRDPYTGQLYRGKKSHLLEKLFVRMGGGKSHYSNR